MTNDEIIYNEVNAKYHTPEQRRVHPGAYRGRRGLLPVPVPGCWRWH